jgi:hypothetical protein
MTAAALQGKLSHGVTSVGYGVISNGFGVVAPTVLQAKVRCCQPLWRYE